MIEKQKPVVLCILDGWGLSDSSLGNAPLIANTPTLDKISSFYPKAHLITHGPDVGLPEGQMGNSEVGHTNIGAGRIVKMDLGKINDEIKNKTFFKRPGLNKFSQRLKQSTGTAHLIGLLSDGGVHGHIEHFLASMNYLAKQKKIKTVLHLIADGRDVSPKSVMKYLKLFSNLPDNVSIGTIMGRFYAMDRDNNWDRTEIAYNAIMFGRGIQIDNTIRGINESYSRDETDEFIKPLILKGYKGVSKNDGLFILNFRPDRVLQLTESIVNPKFNKFHSAKKRMVNNVLGMVDYSEKYKSLMSNIYDKVIVKNSLGSWVSQHKLKQLRVAETEKYPHVTFFFNGGSNVIQSGEDRFMPDSPKVETYDLCPEMSANKVTNKIVEGLDLNYDLIIANYANPDMVGHSGNLDATIKACEKIDSELNKLLDKLEKTNSKMLIISDHGNCEKMIDRLTGEPHTAHTLNLVPIILVGHGQTYKLKNGRLADVAPTLLDLMNLPKPKEMTGESLIEEITLR